MEESSGLVFVLLPGGTFWMGAQKEDPDGRNYDPAAQSDEGPVHEVELSAFFLSKYEMTQGQWKRLAGSNPSRYGPDGTYGTSWNREGKEPTLLEPVEQVSWYDCVGLLSKLGLVLPSEAQWEYGARGGTETSWWSGSEKESLQGTANLADRYARDHGGSGWTGIEEWLDDGYTSHAPVNTLEANDFGLHHVHGNLWEWCLDGYDGNSYRKEQVIDPVVRPMGSTNRVGRGGSFGDAAANARSAGRDHATPAGADDDVGLRVVRVITD